MRKVFDFFVEFLATGFYAGKSVRAPGTVGTFVGFLLFIPVAGHPIPFWCLFAVLILLSVPVSTAMEKRLCSKDPQSVVIDEIVGYFVAVAGLAIPVFPETRFFLYAAMAFILFRLFDIWKPFPIRQLQRLPSGWGIVIDDIIAGLFANILLRVFIHFFPRI
jgi:phosphatidylglycerophosphatase A